MRSSNRRRTVDLAKAVAAIFHCACDRNHVCRTAARRKLVVSEIVAKSRKRLASRRASTMTVSAMPSSPGRSPRRPGVRVVAVGQRSRPPRPRRVRLSFSAQIQGQIAAGGELRLRRLNVKNPMPPHASMAWGEIDGFDLRVLFRELRRARPEICSRRRSGWRDPVRGSIPRVAAPTERRSISTRRASGRPTPRKCWC